MKSRQMIVSALLALAVCAGAEELQVVGTGAGMNIVQEIADDFMKANPGESVLVPESVGSGGGITAVGEDEEKVGRVSRTINDKEKKYGLSYREVARIPIVFYVNPATRVTKLKSSQILDIYAGKVTNWKQVGGADLPIVVVRREKGDSSLDTLSKTLKGFSTEMITSKAVYRYSDPDTTDFVGKTGGTIAFGTLANAVAAKLPALAIDDVQPSTGSYPYVGMLALIYKDKNLAGSVKAFVDFATSAQAKAAILRASGTPLD